MENNTQIDINKLSVVEIKALCWDLSLQQNAIQQQLNILTNELIRRQQEHPKPYNELISRQQEQSKS